METLLIEAKDEILTEECIRQFSRFPTFCVHDDGVILVGSESSRCYLREPSPTEGPLNQLHVDYKDVELAKQLLLVLIADRDDVWVDTDFGLRVDGQSLAQIILTRPNWTWKV